MPSSLEQCLKPGNLIHGVVEPSFDNWRSTTMRGLLPPFYSQRRSGYTHFPWSICFALMGKWSSPQERYDIAGHYGPRKPISSPAGLFAIGIIVSSQNLLQHPIHGDNLHAVGTLFTSSNSNETREFAIEDGRVFDIPIGRTSKDAFEDEVHLIRVSPKTGLTPDLWTALTVHVAHLTLLTDWNKTIGGPVADLPIFGISPDGKSFVEG